MHFKKYQITVTSIKELRSNYAVICSNGVLSEMCVQYLTYCRPDEYVNMKLIVAYLCCFYMFSVYLYILQSNVN